MIVCFGCGGRSVLGFWGDLSTGWFLWGEIGVRGIGAISVQRGDFCEGRSLD